MKKVIIIDTITLQVYVAPYDENTFSDFADYLIDFNKKYRLNVSYDNCQWQVINELNLTVL